MGALKAMLIDEPEDIQVQREYACNSCGKVNEIKQIPMKLSDFNKMAADSPDTHWKEATEKGILYRHHESSTAWHCRMSCQ